MLSYFCNLENIAGDKNHIAKKERECALEVENCASFILLNFEAYMFYIVNTSNG